MTHVPWPEHGDEDAGLVHQVFDDMLFALGADLLPSPTPEQLVEGYATYPHGDHEHTIEVGWRKERSMAEEKARRESAMASCPYRACECGYHEDPR
jgi:hypothetical protein